MDRASLILRLGVLVSVGLALAGWRLPTGVAPAAAVEVRDLSASLGRRPPVGPEEARADWLAVADGVRWVAPGGAAGGLARGASMLGAALLEVATRYPGRDVLLVSDGRATDDALAGARALRAAGGRVFTQAPQPPCADVGLVAARLARAGAGEGVRVLVRVGASSAGAVRLLLLREGRGVDARELTLGADEEQQATLTDPEAPAEAVGYLVRLEALPGTPNDDPGNDEIALGLAPERPSVRVWGDLELEALRMGERGPEVSRLPTAGAADLGAADLVVLAGVPWAQVGPAGAEALARFVAEGGRLLVLGGPGAYGPGGWGGTGFERDLAALRVRRPAPDAVAIAVALDVSGSTEGAALAALKQAAREALAGLQAGERLALVPFRGAGSAAPLAPGFVSAGDSAGAARLARALDALLAGGPTDLVAGMAGALEALEGAGRVEERRLLLLTDGDPDERPDAQALAQLAPRLAAARVRLGALVVGMPAAAEALRTALAERPEDVLLLEGSEALASRLLAQLARQRARTEAERLGSPLGVDLLPGTWASTLPSDGPWSWVHDVEAVEGAAVVGHARLVAPQGARSDFAAERAYGAGRVHALAWGPGAEADPGAAARRLAPLVKRLAEAADRGLEAELDARGRLRVALPEQEGRGRLTLVAGGDLLRLLEVAPGLFETEVALPEVSDVRVRGAGLERVLRLPARPPLEHRGVGADRARLEALALAGGGSLLPPDARPPRGPAAQGPPLAPLFLLLAAILLVVERRRAWRTPPAAAEEPM